ncbi:MAG: hypothetical protein AAGK14_05125 [Verrucomicrobiota bacterium]
MENWLQSGLSAFFAKDLHIHLAVWIFGYLALLLALGGLCLLAFRAESPAAPPERTGASWWQAPPSWLVHPAFFWLLAVLGMALLWVPNLSVWEANADESIWMAGAHTLAEDPRYWLSVDGTTAGPLVIYPLMVLPALGLPLDYGVIRVFNVLTNAVSTGALLIFFLTVCRSRAWSLLLTLPYVVLITGITYVDLIAYNSEQPSVILLSLGLILVCLALREKPWLPLLCLFLAGFFLGCLPFAKLQAAPVGVALALPVAGWLLWQQRWIAAGLFVVGGLAPTGLLALYLTQAGLWTDFWSSYITGNLVFAERGFYNRDLSTLWKIRRFLLRVVFFEEFIPWLVAFALVLPFLFYRAWQRRREWLAGALPWWPLVVLMLLAGLYVNIRPVTHHVHHYIFTFLPSALALGLLAWLALRPGDAEPRSAPPWLAIGAFLLAFAVCPGFFLAGRGNESLAIVKKNHNRALSPYPWSERISTLSEPGDRLTVWGFRSNLHVETGLPQGTREVMSQFLIQTNEWEEPVGAYYLERYLTDLQRNRPRFIVDITGPEDQYFRDDKYRIENYPTIWEFVRENYDLLSQDDAHRLYELKSPAALEAPAR